MMRLFSRKKETKVNANPPPGSYGDKEQTEEFQRITREARELTKDSPLFPMETIMQNAQQFPNDQMWQDVKNPEEYDYRTRALSYSVTGELEQCIDCCNKGLEINENSLFLLYMRGRTYSDLGKLEEGCGDLAKAISANDNFAEAWHELGRIHHKNNDMDNAMLAYAKAYYLEPENFEIYEKDPNTGQPLQGSIPKFTQTLDENGVNIVMNFVKFLQELDGTEITVDGYFAMCIEAKFLPEYLLPPKNIQLNIICESYVLAKAWCEKLGHTLSDDGIQNNITENGGLIQIEVQNLQTKSWEPAVIIQTSE